MPLLISTTFLIAAYLFMPVYLQSSTPRNKADAVILMVGYDNEMRRSGAKSLVRQGYARYLLIPANGKILLYDREKQRFQPIKAATPLKRKWVHQWQMGEFKCPENTQIELMMGMEMMDRLGLKSAIVVSSPYHMRRIRMILDHINRDSGKRFLLAPAGDSHGFDPKWVFDKDKIEWIFLEYAKIIWFQAYRSLDLCSSSG